MHDILKLQKKIVPEILDLLQKRYNILRNVKYNQPIGRRVLANNLALGERTIRNEVNFLKDQKLIDIYNEGMYITAEGEDIINNLQNFIHESKGLVEIEQKIQSFLNINKVFVVPGDYEEDKSILTEVGRTSANYVKDIIKEDMIISLTGGRSVKELVDNMPKVNKYKNILVVPARGGMGKDMEIQANTLAAKLSEKVGGNYKLLHVPDNLSENALQSILQEKSIQEIVEKITNCNILIFGIGRADEMAARRELSKDLTKEILQKFAVGEALGNYYDINGHIIYNNSTIGVKDEDTKNIDQLIAIAAGESKAEAIISILINREKSVLITDEGAAKKIINIIKEKEQNNN